VQEDQVLYRIAKAHHPIIQFMHTIMQSRLRFRHYNNVVNTISTSKIIIIRTKKQLTLEAFYRPGTLLGVL